MTTQHPRCERCFARPPSISAWLGGIKADPAPAARFPLLSIGWRPYEDDPEHGTCYMEIAASPDYEDGDATTEHLLGGVPRGGVIWREVFDAAPRVRLPLGEEDLPGDLRLAGGVRFLGAQEAS